MSSIVFIGAPGVGKGTQREKLIQKYSYFASIVPGDIMRGEVKKRSEIGIELEEYINKGLLAPHDLAMKCVIGAIEDFKREGKEDFVFDGFPREIPQALAIDEYFGEHGFDAVIFFQLDDEIAVQRIRKRALTSDRADDFDEEIIRTRFREFHEKMQPVLDHYKDILHVIDANQTPDEIFCDLEITLCPFLKR